MTFVEACQFLGREPGPREGGPRPGHVRLCPAWEPRGTTAPGATWQEKAGAFLGKAQRTLWGKAGTETRAWLNTEKGLSDATIKEAGLGFNPAEIYAPRESWGLDRSQKEDGTERRLWLPAGLVIPLIAGGKVARLRVRRPNGEPRYCLIPGSDARPITWNLERGAAVIVESELDGILLNQEAGDFAGVVAMGTATAKPDKPTHNALTNVEMILVCLDSDEAGARASWKFWPESYGMKAKRWPIIRGKDPSEARQNGLDLRDWLIAGIFETFEAFERFCIQTVDGGLSDREALKELRQC
jgi:DNA primase